MASAFLSGTKLLVDARAFAAVHSVILKCRYMGPLELQRSNSERQSFIIFQWG